MLDDQQIFSLYKNEDVLIKNKVSAFLIAQISVFSGLLIYFIYLFFTKTPYNLTTYMTAIVFLSMETIIGIQIHKVLNSS